MTCVSFCLSPVLGGGRRVVAGGPSHLSTTKNLLWPVSIPPVESVTYSKNVQTDPLPELEQKLPTDDNTELPDDPNQADEQSGSDDVEPENSDDVTAAETDVPVKEEPKIVLYHAVTILFNNRLGVAILFCAQSCRLIFSAEYVLCSDCLILCPQPCLL